LALLTDDELRGVITGQELAYFREVLASKKVKARTHTPM
jgi:hypothetical protein